MSKYNFYTSYARFKEYHTVRISPRNLREFDRNIWRPLQARAKHNFLELGCGLGHILLCLKAKGVSRFRGTDTDKNIAAHLSEEIRSHFTVGDANRFLRGKTKGEIYDRVIMLDLLEHLTANAGFSLLSDLHRRTAQDAKILIRVPNAASPWGLQNQFGDVTHITAYTPASLKQIAIAADWKIEKIYPHREGSAIKIFTDAVFHRFVAAMASRPPEI